VLSAHCGRFFISSERQLISFEVQHAAKHFTKSDYL
jgi:hypothetical protein